MQNEQINKIEIMNDIVMFENDDLMVEAFFNERSQMFNIWINGETIAIFKTWKPFAAKLEWIIFNHKLVKA